MFSRLRSLWQGLWRRSEFEQGMDEELNFHLEARTDDLMRSGLSRDEAARRARVEFGGVEAYQDRCREARGLHLFDDILNDLRYGLRMLRKSPGFTFLAVMCLALGIGVNTSVFTLLDFVYLRPLPVPGAQRLTILSRQGNPLFPIPDYLDYRDRNQVFTTLAASFPTESSLDSNGEGHITSAEAVSANYAAAMGVSCSLGRWFTDEGEPVAVISYNAWQRLFNSDPNILGKLVRSETQWYTVIGVAPPEFSGIYAPISTEIWIPLQMWTRQYPEAVKRMSDRAHPWPLVMIVGRLKPSLPVSQAAAIVNAIDGQIRHEHPTTTTGALAPVTVEPIHGAPNPNSRREAVPFITLLFLVVGAVLLIACVNVSNLLLARGAVRQREFSLRAALGASRSRLLRQLLTETLLLTLLGMLGGIFLGHMTNRLLNGLLQSLPFEAQMVLHLDLSLGSRVFAFTLGTSALCTLLCGLIPAWRSSRVDVFPVLKGESLPKERFRLRHVSLVAQVALSLVLLLCAGLFLRSIQRIQTADPGFAIKNRLYVMTYISAPEFTPVTGLQFYDHVVERLRNLPGVHSASLTRFLPLMAIGQETDCVSTAGFSSSPFTLGVIDPNFLGTMQIPLIEGRNFSPADSSSSPPVVLVNQTLARRFWPNTGVVGQHLQLGCNNPIVAEVVGVVRDTKVRSLGEIPQPHFYRPFAQRYTGLATLIVEATSDPAALAPNVRSAVQAESDGVRIYALEALVAHIERSYWMVRAESSMLFLFGILALLLAAVGLYGIMAFHVAQRTHEIGVRLALGAQSRDVYRLFLLEGLKTTLLGILLGVAISAGFSRLLARFLSGLSPTDPFTYVSTALLWVGVALLACYGPARRAMRVDPMVALRHE
ncbi:MAG: ABC transporter permease [Acidobacteriia bacterium]|nr:ABC transporter permease [Terriglobia bacterium]